MAPLAEAGPSSAAPAKARSWLRVALLGLLGMGALFTLILFAYELARARVPQHRAALERLVRGQTGLDVRFTELGLRWGWYGPEAVFHRVELDEPGNAEALLRAPELVVGFDVWRTLRSGHPEAGRIELIAPEIDFRSHSSRPPVGFAIAGAAAADCGATSAIGSPALVVAPAHDARATGAAPAAAGDRKPPAAVSGAPTSRCAGNTSVALTGPTIALESSALGRVAVLQRWRGGRIDIEGGTVRLPATAAGGANPLSVQIRRATLRRSDDEWNVVGLLFLPDRVGRSARVTLDVKGDLSKASALSGSLRVEARRLLFPGSRDFLAGLPEITRFLPRGGHGDLSVDLSFEHSQVMKAHGSVHAGGLVFDAPGEALMATSTADGNASGAVVGKSPPAEAPAAEAARAEAPPDL